MEGGLGREVADEALAWRDRLALRLLRALVVVLALATSMVWFVGYGTRDRQAVTALLAIAASVCFLASLTGRPNGERRAWLVVLTSAFFAIVGYAFVGCLSAPGAVLTVTVMLTGLLLGRRAMIGLTVACGLVLFVIAWAFVQGRVEPPDPRNFDMTSALTWGRSLGMTFLANLGFGGLMVAVVSRIESSLGLARQETFLREHADRARVEAERSALESKQLEVVGRLAAGIAHDFNNHLTAIMGCAELLQQEAELGSGPKELADSILHSSKRVAELTRQLLAYSRRAQMQRIPTDLHGVLDEALSLVRRSLDPNVRVVTNLAAANATVNADVALLQSAVLNLLVNASDAMPQGGTLTVSTNLLELPESATGASGPSGACLLLEVHDTGRGIDKDLLPQVFEPFFTTKPIGRGTGLGLAAVAGTVKTHGGRVEVESEVGVGTVFRVFLPSAEARALTSSSSSDLIVRGTGEVLLVEDDAMVGVTAVRTLETFGYRVTRVADGGAGLELVRAHPGRFALVLLDLRMPGPSGETTFDALRALAPKLKILIWSGYVAEHDVEAMLRRGAAGFIQKPYRIAELSRVVAQALQ